MSNETLMREWQKKLPGRIPEGQELSAFAVGVEVGLDHARKLEREDWSRVHHVLFKHGVHPGRTDDHLADVIDKALAAPPAPAAVPLLTDAQVDAISMGLFGCINAAYRKQITDAVLSSGGGGITCATKRTVAQVRTATSAVPAAVPPKLWLWKNFVGRPEYWAFDNPFPVHMDCGDPQTLGEPCGYAIFKPSRQGRTDVSEAEVLRRIAAAGDKP